MRRKRKKPKEFSQKLVIVSWIVTIVWIFLSYILAFFERNPNETVTVTLVIESFGVTLSYFCYQAILKTSRNKHSVDKDGMPFKIKTKIEGLGIIQEDSKEGRL
jgi:RsiW-degrading membrane proteinase PrsW (M82 family)